MNKTTTFRIGTIWLAAGLVVALAGGGAWADDPAADQPVVTDKPVADQPPTGQDLLSMEESLRGPEATSQAGRKQLVALIEKQHLASAAATRTVAPAQWRELVKKMSADLGAPSRATWLAGIRAAYAPDPADMQKLSDGEALAIASLCRQLGDPQADTLLEQLEPMWAAGKVDWSVCKDVARAWRGRDSQKPGRWALRACKGLVVVKPDWIECAEMVNMSSLFADLKIHGGFDEFATLMTIVARQGKLDAGPWEHCPVSARELGAVMLTPKSRQPLYAELTNDKGHARAGAWEVLAWSHCLSATPMEWVKYLDDKIAATKGDAQAYWLMARAYAQTVNMCGATDPFEGRKFINQAYAAAESDETRLYVARRIAMGYAYIVERAKGQAFLDSIAGQFAGEAKDSFARLQQDFDELCGNNEKYLAAKRAHFAAREEAERKWRLTGTLENALAAPAAP
ncbi:MAG: hypothetical protein NTV86_08200 [Planctomycetota bacterium]|nr:hypothetical protein [Planctomycetota bacterium]